MDCAIVCLQINSYFLSSEIGSEESNWRVERMQSKVSEGSDSSFLPINCRHCLTQLVLMVKCASHSILQYGTEDVFDSPYCAILQRFQSNSILTAAKIISTCRRVSEKGFQLWFTQSTPLFWLISLFQQLMSFLTNHIQHVSQGIDLIMKYSSITDFLF